MAMPGAVVAAKSPAHGATGPVVNGVAVHPGDGLAVAVREPLRCRVIFPGKV